METDQLGRLRDILDAARLIASYVKDTTESAFRSDFQKQDAVIRRIEIIVGIIMRYKVSHAAHFSKGELIDGLSRSVAQMRSGLAVDLKIVWEVATVHIPEISAVLERFLAQQE
jgi:uncharacterized protein with HEPN domain